MEAKPLLKLKRSFFKRDFYVVFQLLLSTGVLQTWQSTSWLGQLWHHNQWWTKATSTSVSSRHHVPFLTDKSTGTPTHPPFICGWFTTKCGICGQNVEFQLARNFTSWIFNIFSWEFNKWKASANGQSMTCPSLQKLKYIALPIPQKCLLYQHKNSDVSFSLF